MDVYCTNCDRLMVPHTDNVHVCLGCSSRVQVKDTDQVS